MDPLRLEMGLNFESILEEGLKKRLNGGERVGELVTEEGIAYSPDLIIFNGHTRLGEIKLTYMSCREMPVEQANGMPAKFDKWQCQMKFYCRALETPYARLFGFFVLGDYDKKQMPGPQLRAWDIEYSKRELDENHAMLIHHARHVGLLK